LFLIFELLNNRHYALLCAYVDIRLHRVFVPLRCSQDPSAQASYMQQVYELRLKTVAAAIAQGERLMQQLLQVLFVAAVVHACWPSCQPSTIPQ
jgi:hypothetical protein